MKRRLISAVLILALVLSVSFVVFATTGNDDLGTADGDLSGTLESGGPDSGLGSGTDADDPDTGLDIDDPTNDSGDSSGFAPMMMGALGLDITTQAELQAAIDNASVGGTITLTHDIEIGADGQPLMLPAYSINIEGNNKKLTLAPGYHEEHIQMPYINYTSYTIRNLTIQGHNSGVPSASNFSSRVDGGGIKIEHHSTFVLENIVFSGNHYALRSGAALSSITATVTVNNCTFANNSAKEGGAVYHASNSGALTYNNCVFTDNYSPGFGGAMSNNIGVNLYGCTFTRNQTSVTNWGGGAIYGYYPNIVDCVFTDNAAPNASGGAAYLRGSTYSNSATITGCTFDSNSARTGGAVHCDFLFTIEGGSFINNTATSMGGAIDNGTVQSIGSYDVDNNYVPSALKMTIRPDNRTNGTGGTYFNNNTLTSGKGGYFPLDNPGYVDGLGGNNQYAVATFYSTQITGVTGISQDSANPYIFTHIYNNIDVTFSPSYYVIFVPTDGAILRNGASQMYALASAATNSKLAFPSGYTVEKTDHILVGWRFMTAQGLYDYGFQAYSTEWRGYADRRGELVDPDEYLTCTVFVEPVFARVADWTVTFDMAGGSAVPSQTVTTGNLATRPADPTREGYVFGGWYKDSALTQVWDFDTERIYDNTTIYAKWTLKPVPPLTYAVTYVGNGHTGGVILTPGRYTATTPIGVSALQPTRTGYVFIGWQASHNGLIYGSNSTFVMPQQDVVLTAQWRSETAPATYTVSFNSRGGSSVAPIPDVQPGATIAPPQEPSKENDVFLGWYKDMNVTEPWDFAADTVNADITLYAKWQNSGQPIEPGPPTDPGSPVGNGDNPQQTTDIGGNTIPLIGGEKEHWALVNLLLAGAAGVVAIVKVVGFFVRRKDEGETDKKSLSSVLIAAALAIGGAVAFLLTEDTSLPMAFTDKWTLLMAAFPVGQIIASLLLRKKGAK